MGRRSRRDEDEVVRALMADASLGLTEAEARAIAAGDDLPDVDADAPATATALRDDHARAAMNWLRAADPDGFRGATRAISDIAGVEYGPRVHRAADLTVAHAVLALLAEQRRTNELLTDLLAAARTD